MLLLNTSIFTKTENKPCFATYAYCCILNDSKEGRRTQMDSLQFILITGIIVVMLVNISLLAWVPAYLERQLQKRQLTTSKTYDVRIEDAKLLDEIDVEEVNKQIHKQLTKVAENTAKRLEESLNNTVDRVASNIDEQTSVQLSQEFEKYEVSLQALRDQSIVEFGKLQKELDKRRAELLDQLERDVAKEREKRIEAINGRISDVITSYLIETLGDQVDLGAQTNYIFAALEQRKDDIKKDVVT